MKKTNELVIMYTVHGTMEAFYFNDITFQETQQQLAKDKLEESNQLS